MLFRSFAGTAWKAIQLGITFATKAWAAAQWLLNASMHANPIGIVIVIIAALVAAVILAWKHSQTFRNIVMGAWAGIQAAVSFAWNNVLKPVLTAIGHFVTNVVGPAFGWLWNNVIQPVWNGIKQAFSIGWSIVSFVFHAWMNVMGAVKNAIMFLWNNVVTPVWNGIKLAFSIGWQIVSFVFGAWVNIMGAVKNAINFLWRNVVIPVWNGIKAEIGRAHV